MLGKCKLCELQAELKKSHILPKSFVKRIRGGEAQLFKIPGEGMPRVQKTNGEYIKRMLCGSCEQLLDKNFEKYGTQLFVNSENFLEDGKRVLFTKFDYQRYFLFILSILWRGAVSGLAVYKQLAPLTFMSEAMRSCLMKNSMSTLHLIGFKIDRFMKLSIVRIFDPSGQIPQDAIDKVILGVNAVKGSTLSHGVSYHFMVDGFYITCHIFPPDSRYLANWCPPGRILNRRFISIPKVAISEIELVREAFNAAIASGENKE